MKIAQVSPLYESVPPKLYGGTERVVSYLTEELVNQGYDVTLFSSGDSITQAKLVACCPHSLRLDTESVDHLAHQMLMLERVFQRAQEFDIIHFHIDYFHFPLSRRHDLPNVTTLHGRLDIPDLVPIYREFPEMPVVSISDAQRMPLSWINWQSTIYHGLPLDLYTFNEKDGDYLVFVGRISPEKRVDRAIEVAKRTGMKLVIAAKVDKVDQDYFEEKIEPILDHPLIEYIGEVNESEKNDLLGNAYAFVFPIDWPEPFGLAMVEAMACGTPVITVPCGSTPEIIEQGVNGFICETVDDMVEAVPRVAGLDRRLCRESFESRFSAPRMARDYVEVYRRLIAKKEASRSALDILGGWRPADLVDRPLAADGGIISEHIA